MSFQQGWGEVGLKGPYVALTPSPIIAVLENRKKIAKRDKSGGGGVKCHRQQQNSFSWFSSEDDELQVITLGPVSLLLYQNLIHPPQPLKPAQHHLVAARAQLHNVTRASVS